MVEPAQPALVRGVRLAASDFFAGAGSHVVIVAWMLPVQPQPIMPMLVKGKLRGLHVQAPLVRAVPPLRQLSGKE